MNYIKNKLVNVTGYFGVDDSNRITKNIHVGNYKSAFIDYIIKEQFDVIINCTPDIPFQSINTLNHRIPVYDDLTFHSNVILAKHITKILPIIHEYNIANKKILIHCRAGMQRSAAVLAAYLIKYNNMSLDTSINTIREYRPCAFLFGSNFNVCLSIM
tara:strand:+ start:210 stop:683 length:474 start_codon:yes stop_codon:yes gene_type:complete